MKIVSLPRASSVVRWILVVPSAIIAWYVAVLVSAVLVAFLIAPCMDSDAPQPQFCEAAWFDPVRRGVFFFGVGLSAILVVTISALVAPSHRTAVAWTAVGTGSAVALVMGYPRALIEAVVAIACGVVAAVVVARIAGASRATLARTDALSDRRP